MKRQLEHDLNALARELAPQRSLAADILRRLHKQAPVPPKSTWTRSWIMRSSIGIAAAALITVLLLLLTGQKPAFAQVLEKVEKTKSMSCDVEGGEEGKIHIAIRGDMLRCELPGGVISIGNRTTGAWVTLNPMEHTAMKINMARQSFDFYAWFHDFKDGKEESLGNKQINGKKATGFRVTRSPLGEEVSGTKPDVPIDIWVDSATNLPVDVEGTDNGHAMRYTNFTWDEPLDEKLFAVNIPEGYKIQDMGGIAADKLLPPPATREAAKLILHPGVGIGELKFGDAAARITELLGPPEKISNTISWDYPSKGLWLTVNAKQGVIALMAGSKKAFPSFNVNDFPGKLDNGLTLGASREDVEKAFGKPDRTDAAGNNQEAIYYDKVFVWFMLQDGKVIQIYLHPNAAARDAIRARLATQPTASQPTRP